MYYEDIMMHPESGTKVVLEHDGYLLAIRHDDPSGVPDAGQWDYVGGPAEPGELALPPEEGLLICGERELKEHLGLIGVRLYMLNIDENQGTPGLFRGWAFGRLADRHVSEIHSDKWYKFWLPEDLVTLDLADEVRDYTWGLCNLDFRA